MKNIAIVCNYVLRPDRIGGMDRFFVAYDKRAKELGYKVTWFFAGYNPFPFYKGLTIHSPQNKQNVEAYFLEHLEKHNNEFSILITHFASLCGPFYKKVKEQTSIKHTIVVDHNPRPLNGFPLKKRIKKRMEGLLYQRYVDQFVGVSQYTVNHIINDLGRLVKSKSIRIYNGIDTSVFTKAKRNTELEPTIKFAVVSHLRHSKGIQDLLKALTLLNTKVLVKIKIDIYGEGPLEAELKREASKNRLDEVIAFKGSSSEIPRLLHKYDYLLQPTHMECFSLSILESLSANVPVITTTVGGNPEIIDDGKNGFTFEAKDIKALASILESLINGKLSIEEDTSILIEKEYHLDRMVTEHLQLLS